jgi:hypothetical protein
MGLVAILAAEKLKYPPVEAYYVFKCLSLFVRPLCEGIKAFLLTPNLLRQGKAHTIINLDKDYHHVWFFTIVTIYFILDSYFGYLIYALMRAISSGKFDVVKFGRRRLEIMMKNQ